MTLRIAKIVTTLTENGWSQIHTFCPEPGEKFNRRGHLLALLSLKGIGHQQASELGREVIFRLHEEYYGELNISPLIGLKKAISKVAGELGDGVKLTVVAIALVDKILYLAILGRGRVVLARQGKLAVILAGQGQSIVTASGHLQDEDIFLIGTKDFFQSVPEKIIQTALLTGSADEAAAMLAPIAHEASDQALVAAAVAKTEEEFSPKPNLSKSGGKENWKKKLSKIIRLKTQLESRHQEKSKKTLLTVGLTLLLILAVSVFLGKQQRNRLAKKQKMTVLLAQIDDKEKEGKSLIKLDPIQAKKILLEAQDLIKEAEKENNSNKNLARAKEKIALLLPQVLREHQVKPTVFFDLGLIKDGAEADEAALSSGNLLILDKKKAVVYSLSLAERKSAIIGGGDQLKDSLQITASWPQTFVLTKQGLLKIPSPAAAASLVIKADWDYHSTVSGQLFAGNFYLLTKKTIWRYAAAQTGFGSKKNWLQSPVDFSQVVSMAIDGSIWILKSDGQVLKFIRGRPAAFGIAGLDKPFDHPQAIFTDGDQKNLYILDQNNARIVVLAKSGEYQAQYEWPGIKQTNALIVSEKENKIYLFNKNKIYAIEIE